MRNPTAGILRSIFPFTALLATAAVHAQQNITIQAANSVFNQILSVSFAPPAPPGSTTVLNTDASSLHRLESLVLVTNPKTFTVDLLAADDGGQGILDYVGDFTTGAFTCPPSNTNPPCTTGNVVTQAANIHYPNGLSADPFGNVFAVNNAPGKSPLPAVWALPTDGTGGYLQAVQIDATSPTGSLGQQQAVVETLIVRTRLGSLANAGDLLVVSQNPDEILLYPGNGAGAGPLSQNFNPTILIPQCPAQGACIPAGSTPGGIAVWPADNSLLVTTFNGPILRFGITGGTITQLTTVNGAPSALYKINTGLVGGAAVAYIAQTAPGNHGSILQLVPSAGNGIQLSPASVTAGVFAPQGIAVTNSVQTTAASCAQAAGGCDLFGNDANKHTVIPDASGNLHSNITESLCLVPQDPRVSFPGGHWACNGNPLPVNQVCPGFDNTGHGMTIPGYACGASGSSGSAFALIKTLTAPDQFNGTYVQTEEKLDALFAGANNPVCGPGGTDAVFWAPLVDETYIAEEGVNIATGGANPMPTMVDTTDGCGSGKSGGPTQSLYAPGVALALQGGNTTTNLEGFVQQKYPFLQMTINELAGNGNIPAGVAQQLTNGAGTGCFDLSLSLFNKAVNEPGNNPQQLTQQQIYDFQDAADLLTNADTTSTTTCDSIVTTNANLFQETLGPPPVWNPTGQVRWRFANINNGTTMRILGKSPAGTWPPPVSLSVSPQYMFAQCVAQGCPPQQNPSTATLSWALVNGASNCTWTSNDGNFNSHQPNLATPSVKVGPFATPGTTYKYLLTCKVPAGTVPPAANNTLSATTYLTVWPAVIVSTSAQSIVAGQSVQVTWTPPTGATACRLTDNGQGTFNAGSTTFVPGPATNPPTPYVASYLTNSHDVANGVTFVATCTAGASAAIASITVTHH